ncbi:NAD(+) diphosphatase [Lachnoclostridium sp. Marseille-P6806]|uniref:NAD(+) diphosphatase n=1 Tax=Lachnoclostridium sp. Marseille-P6806 TaxID=2364793 RepID=UPI0010317317|nr:NAD(+) diphosphatase [Lachnoclostridium sp. Marseille-P6806]
MIQDIGEGIFHNEYTSRAAGGGDIAVLFGSSAGRLFAGETEDGRLRFPEAVQAMSCLAGETGFQYLFSLGGAGVYTRLSPVGPDEAERLLALGFRERPLRVLRSVSPRELCFAAETAYQLFWWYMDNRHCGRCGSKMSVGTKLRTMNCPACGHVVFPKIMPAVIVGVVDGSRILMTRYAGREYKGNALIAGFCEIGETAEDTVRREVMEEAGIRVRNIRYYKSQPWGFDSDLLLGFFCELDGDRTIRMDSAELAQAEWVERQAITEEFQNMSLTNEMICRFREGTF